ncbi:MAG: NADH-quinone oxidoreductase subunit C [Candidatus Bathyarchaeia archaeon]
MTRTELETRIVKETRSRFRRYVVKGHVQRKGRIFLSVKKDGILEILRFLDKNFDLNHPVSVTGTDMLRDRLFELVYHVSSVSNKVLLTMKTQVPRDDPKVPSIISVLPGADWHEREMHEMLGVNFDGNPNVGIRVLLPEDWDEGYPLRKDYKLRKWTD